MLVLEIAHAHTASDIACNAVFEQLDVRDFLGLFDEIRNFAFGGGEFLVGAEWPQTLGDDVMVPEAHVNRIVFLGNELQELHVGEVVVRDIARDAASISR